MLRDLAEFSAHDCADLRKIGMSTSGVYNISLAGKTVAIWCDMTSEGDWLVSVICRLTFKYYNSIIRVNALRVLLLVTTHLTKTRSQCVG